MTCFKCNALVNKGWTCCGCCGAELPYNTIEPASIPESVQSENSNEQDVCPVCGARQLEGALFCISCGSHVAAGDTSKKSRSAWWSLSAEIRDEQTARRAARRAAVVCLILAGVLFGAALLVGAGTGADRKLSFYLIAEGAAYLVLGLGIRRMSRLCAVAALLLYIIDWIASSSHSPLALIWGTFLAIGVKGVYRHWRFRREQASGVISSLETLSAPALR
jgi:hypothetical protein